MFVLFVLLAVVAVSTATALAGLAEACKPTGRVAFWVMYAIAVGMFFVGVFCPRVIRSMIGM